MPPLVRRYIKTSLVFLIAGLLLGGYLILAEFVIGRYPPRLFITAHVHLLLVGFMLMIVMGVATWMFPRAARDSGGYRPGLAEVVYWVMTVSTAIRAGRRACGAVRGLMEHPPADRRRRSRAARRRSPLRREHVVARPDAGSGRASESLIQRRPARRASCPWRAKSIDSPGIRAASCGA